jgi:hypothetical protein
MHVVTKLDGLVSSSPVPEAASTKSERATWARMRPAQCQKLAPRNRVVTAGLLTEYNPVFSMK